ncbi:MAG: polysaccharide biosynthesis tyrosine autokinase [Alphaproteobacteria bacterium]|nr:MAG: polysaccharide biosynthesis tyrosine autokinase [Alphaproteobacteria bacterium]
MDGLRRDWVGPTKPASATDSDDEIDLLELLRTLWRGKLWLMLGLLAGVLLGGLYAYRLATPVYRANATVALENRQAQFVDLQNVMSGLSGDQATINTELEVLRSRSLMNRLTRELDLVNDPEFNASLQPAARFSVRALLEATGLRSPAAPPGEREIFESTVNRVRAAFDISNIRSSYVFNISATTTDPEKSAKLANALANLYINDQIDVKFEATAKATKWLTGRVATLKDELEKAEAAAKSFAAETRLVGPEALDALGRQIKETRERLDRIAADIEARRARVDSMARARASGDREAMRAATSDPALTSSAAADMTDGAFMARFGAALDRERRELARLAQQKAGLEESIKVMEANYDQQSKDLVKLEQLQREADATRLLYEYFLSRLKETSAQAGLQQADSRVLSEAALPGAPAAPKKNIILALSAVLGLIAGAGVVVLREMTHTGFRTAEDVEAQTGHTVLGQIPRVALRARRSVIDYLATNPTSAAAEAIRNLRTSLVLSNVDHPPQVVMVTSSLPGEGKTSTSIALAQNFVGMGKKVLLIEGDIRRRVFSEYFDFPSREGMLAVLSGKRSLKEAVQHAETLGADVLIGEKSHVNAADLFSSDRFRKLIEEARAAYDVVIIDTAPVLVVPDARIIAQSVDAVLFSVKWDATSRQQVNAALRQFETAGRSVTGIVLSLIDPKGMKRYGYGGNYGAYAAYGSKYYTG